MTPDLLRNGALDQPLPSPNPTARHLSVVRDLPDELSGQVGAELLGVTATPVQRLIWQVMDSTTSGRPTYPMTAIQVPRRAGKTTALMALAVGRCLTRPQYQASYTCQSGVKGRERFIEVQQLLEAASLPGWSAYSARGAERLEFVNGSVLRVHPPKASYFRGDALDLAMLDEGQEVAPEDASELLGAVLPTMDTRPNAQLVVSGTAGAHRTGLLWEALSYGRTGTWGVVDFSAPDDADPDNEDAWLTCHPGIGTLTTLEVIRRNRSMMTAETFAREYLGIWPEPVGTAALTGELWDMRGTELVPKPERFTIGIDVAPDRQDASVVAAWRVDGVAYLEVIDHRPGAVWLRDKVVQLARTYRSVPIAYDARGPVLQVADELAQARPRPNLHGTSAQEFATACAALAAAAVDDKLRHFRDPDLDAAVVGASRRSLGDRWAWSRRSSEVSMSPLIAATVALRAWDANPPKARPRIRAAS